MTKEVLGFPKDLEQKFKYMSQEDQQKVLEAFDEMEKDLLEQERLAKEADPFWHYEPSDGMISPERKQFLLKYLKEEDIPVKLDGQLDVHTSLASIRGSFGGNQSGKTTVGAIEAFIKVTRQLPFALKDKYPKERLVKHDRPVHVRVVGEDYQNGILLNLIPTYKDWVPREFLVGGSWERSYSAEQGVLKLGKHGKLYGTIEFMSNKQDVGSFQGPPRHMMIYDEEPRHDIYKENLMRFTTADSLDIMFCMTPTKGLSWVSDEILQKMEDGAENIDCYKLASVTNKRANLNVLKEIVDGLTSYDERRMRLLGEFVSLSGLIYKGVFDRRVHVIEPFQIEPSYFCVSGLDPHLVKPTAMVFCAVDPEENVYVVTTYQRDADTDLVKRDWHTVVSEKGLRMGWSAMDKSANSDIKAFGGRNIYRELTTGSGAIPAVRLSQKAVGSVHAGVDLIKQYFRNALEYHQARQLVESLPEEERDEARRFLKRPGPGLYIFDTPENKPLIQSIRTLQRDTYANEDEKGMKDKILEGKHDLHAAMRYPFQHRIHYLPPVEYVPEVEPLDPDTGW